jgi:hypothetical protein
MKGRSRDRLVSGRLDSPREMAEKAKSAMESRKQTMMLLIHNMRLRLVREV